MFLLILLCPMRCALIPHQPSTSQSAVTVEARAKAPTWSSPAWATASPAPSRRATPCWWPPTSPTTSPPPPAAAPSAETRRWVKGREACFLFHSSLLGAKVLPLTPPPHQVKVRLDCPRGRHHDMIEILTAKACRCDMCRKSRYWPVLQLNAHAVINPKGSTAGRAVQNPDE